MSGWLTVNVEEDIAEFFSRRQREFARRLQESVDRVVLVRATEKRRSDDEAKSHEWYGFVLGVGHGSTRAGSGAFRCGTPPYEMKEKKPPRP